jgi:LPXTG-motif cell wall-anchored protein
MKVAGIIVLLVGTVATALASTGVPEIDASSTVSALALLSSSLLILKSRRKK